MKERLLYIQASPRRGRSRSVQVADAFVEAYRDMHENGEIDTLNVFDFDLPVFDGPALEAKYTVLHGTEATETQRRAWHRVEMIIDRFSAAKTYLIATPMWNFNIPYRLKHLIDVIVQPGYTFSYDPAEGYRGLLTGRQAVCVYARGGDYSPPELAGLDMQKPYIELILGFMGIHVAGSITVQPTLMGGPEVDKEKTERAMERARELAREMKPSG